MKTLAIIGSGDLGQQIAHFALTDAHYGKIVFFDDFSSQKTINGNSVLGATADVLNAFQNKAFDELLIGIGYKHLAVKKAMFEKFYNQVPFGKIVHSSSWVDPTASIKRGSVIYPGCSIDANVTICENTIINIGSTIAHDSTIGKHSFLSPRVAIAGFVDVEEQCFIGINSTLIDSIKIPTKTQIGAGSLVIKSIEKSGLYIGSPTRFIRP